MSDYTILTVPELLTSSGKTGKKIYVISPWGKWELDAFWNDRKSLIYFTDHYDDKFKYIAGNADYISLERCI